MSTTATSGRQSRAFSTPCRPSPATSTWCPHNSSSVRSVSRAAGLSSTTRTRWAEGFMGGVLVQPSGRPGIHGTAVRKSAGTAAHVGHADAGGYVKPRRPRVRSGGAGTEKRPRLGEMLTAVPGLVNPLTAQHLVQDFEADRFDQV